MVLNGDLSYEDTQEYQVMLAHFQKGDWEQGMEMLNQLIQKYPLEAELRSLRQEMALRGQIDEYESQETKKVRFASFGKWALRIVVVVVVFAGLLYGANYYASWFRARVVNAQSLVEQQVRLANLQAKYNTVQQYLSSYRAEEARALLEEIQAEDPEYPNLAPLFETADRIDELNTSYEQAMQLKAQGRLDEALAILEGITNYRDVSLQIREIQTSYDLNELVRKGDEAVLNGDWNGAIEIYEDVRNRDSLFMREEIESRLYNSYLNAAKAFLEENPDSLDALQDSRDYFTRALTIRPQDEKVEEELQLARETVVARLFNGYLQAAQAALVEQPDSIAALQKAEEYYAQALQVKPGDQTVELQRNTARAFIQAKQEFDQGSYDNAIRQLEGIYAREPDYANGTARQMLYDAYIFRGDNLLLNGRPTSAIQDYQNAAAIAELRPDSALRLFESKARLGDALGVMGNYETAVFQYRVALEEANISESGVLSPEIDKTLKDAEYQALRGRFKNAWNLYKQAVQNIIENFQTVTVIVASDDYLSQLANYYQTTVNAILAANKVSDPNNISIGDKIVIPVTP